MLNILMLIVMVTGFEVGAGQAPMTAEMIRNFSGKCLAEAQAAVELASKINSPNAAVPIVKLTLGAPGMPLETYATPKDGPYFFVHMRNVPNCTVLNLTTN